MFSATAATVLLWQINYFFNIIKATNIAKNIIIILKKFIINIIIINK